jgi:hypothetical protein
MSEELEQLLKNLRLRRVLEIYDEQLRAADKEDLAICNNLEHSCKRRNRNRRAFPFIFFGLGYVLVSCIVSARGNDIEAVAPPTPSVTVTVHHLSGIRIQYSATGE